MFKIKKQTSCIKDTKFMNELKDLEIAKIIAGVPHYKGDIIMKIPCYTREYFLNLSRPGMDSYWTEKMTSTILVRPLKPSEILSIDFYNE